jgi:hypothetical protein
MSETREIRWLSPKQALAMNLVTDPLVKPCAGQAPRLREPRLRSQICNVSTTLTDARACAAKICLPGHF